MLSFKAFLTKKHRWAFQLPLMVCLVIGAGRGAFAQQQDDDLAKKLQNPIADLISLPLQSNFEFGGGRNKDGFGYILNIQPVIPFSLSGEWNLVTRTIIPVVHQERVFPNHETGLGDIVQSFFLSPKKPTEGGLVWGAGPVFLYPSATNDRIGSLQWGAGPTGVVLVQKGGWTYGLLANHIWSLTGKRSGKPEINTTLIQPFLSYTFSTKTTLSLSTETTYDWTGRQWTVPLIAGASQIVKVGALPLSLGINGKYYAARPEGAPEWGLRFTVTFLFPR